MAFVNDGTEFPYILEGYKPGTDNLDGTIMPNVKMISPEAIVEDGTVITYNQTSNVTPTGGDDGDIWYNQPEDGLYKNKSGTWSLLTDRVVNSWYVGPVQNLTDCPI